MKRFRKILVALTGSSADHEVLVWARRVAEAANSEQVQILILDPDPADWVAEYPPIKGYEPWKDRVRTTADEVATVFEGLPGLSLQTNTAVGSALPTILQELVDSSCDLVVIGAGDEAERILAEKLARKSPASVLSVPPAATENCRAILTPVDFSEPSTLALEVATAFGLSFSSDRLTCLHSFRVSGPYGRTGPPSESLKAAYFESVSDHLAQFLRKYDDTPLSMEPLVREAPIASSAILDELSQGSYDLVVLGTRGRSSIARALLGSNTAAVIRQSPVPVLAVKAKGEGLPFLRALLGSWENTSTVSAPATSD